MASQSAHVEQRVTPLELFFDLVFVFALTQVTGLLADDPSWEGLGRGLLMLAALWWAWAAYAWLTNTIDPDENVARLTVFAAMGAMLVASLAVPEAFGDEALVFALAYFVVRVMHIALYAHGTRDDPDVLGAVLRMTPTAIAGPALIVGGALLDPPAREAVWAVALLIDYLGVLIGRAEGWKVSPGHFAERHGLIIIIAIGESIVSVGAGASTDLDAGVIAAGLLGLTIACALWWQYFDVVAVVAERKLHEATGAARAAQARDSYSYLHLPMVAGIILFAFGIKKILGDTGEPLKSVPAVALCGGLALYYLAHVALRLRNVHTLAKRRLVTAAALIALIPLAIEIDALAALGIATAITTTLVVYEVIRFAEPRRRLRESVRQPAAAAPD
jgi:low temperature requirement protein LtrA